MLRIFLLLPMLFSCLAAAAQPTLRLRFQPLLSGKALELYDGAATDSLRISMLRFYISRITLRSEGRVVWRDEAQAHLLDAADAASMLLELPINGVDFTDLDFRLGIDSATSSAGAQGGDLDPAKGMYWAWQSGYVNFKLEGVSPRSTARKHQFHFHLGGYRQPFMGMREISLPAHPEGEIVVKVDLNKFMSGLDLAKQNSIMIPGEEAFLLSKKAAGIFTIQPQP